MGPGQWHRAEARQLHGQLRRAERRQDPHGGREVGRLLVRVARPEDQVPDDAVAAWQGDADRHVVRPGAQRARHLPRGAPESERREALTLTTDKSDKSLQSFLLVLTCYL